MYYHPLSARPLSALARLSRPLPDGATEQMLNAPAVSMMTDLRRVRAVTVDPDAALNDAHNLMLRRGVRLLFVVDGAGRLHGVLTSNDILGEKPMQRVMSGGVKHAEIRVAEIMTPRERIEALDLADVERTRVGNVVEALRVAGRQHAIVVGEVAGEVEVCGIFSAAELSRRLGIEVVPGNIARTFAEIERELGRSA